MYYTDNEGPPNRIRYSPEFIWTNFATLSDIDDSGLDLTDGLVDAVMIDSRSGGHALFHPST